MPVKIRETTQARDKYFKMEELILENQIPAGKKKSFFRKENAVFGVLIILFAFSALFFLYEDFIPAFAVGTFSNNFTTIDDGENAALWIAISASTKNILATDDLAMQGTNGIEWAVGTAGANNGVYKNLSAMNLKDKQIWVYYWSGVATAVAGETQTRKMLNSMKIELWSGSARSGNSSQWNICISLSDCPQKLNFGWTTLKIYTTQPDTTVGTLDLTSIGSVALYQNTSQKWTKKAGPVTGFDYWRAGTKVSFTGGSASAPVTFNDVKSYSDTNVLGIIDTAGGGSFVNLRSNLEIGNGITTTFFTDTNRFVNMDMKNSDDKINFTLRGNSTTTFGGFENGFAINGNTISYPTITNSNFRSIPFITPDSTGVLPELYLYASRIAGASNIFFGTSTAAAISGGNVFNTEIDSASTTFIYSKGLQFKDVDIHHSTTTSATSTVKLFATPDTEYENIRIFASPANGLDIATTTGGPDQITLKNIALSNNAGYDIRIENPYIVNMVNSSFVNASTTYLNINRGWTLNKQYTFDVKVTDTTGAGISGASVTLKDKNNATAFSVTTGGDGKITQQTVTAFIIAHATSSASVSITDLNNFNLAVTATGKTNVSQTVIINSAQSLTIVMSSECDPDGTLPAYPMRVATTTNPPVITVWGTAGGGEINCGINGNQACTTAMGNTEANAITFDQIRQFGKAAYGECAIKSPATGAFAVISKLNIGTTTATTTFVKTSSEAIDFGFQTQLYASSTFISGEVSATGSPFAGSTLAFSGSDAGNLDEGEFFTRAGSGSAPASVLKLFDSVVLYKTVGSTSPAVTPNIFGKMDANRTSFENWFQVKLQNATNTVKDSVFTNMGSGFFPFVAQGASTTFNTIKPRKITSGGLYATSTAGFRIDNLEITDIDDGKHIRVFNYKATTTLVNSTFGINLTPTPANPGIEFNSTTTLTGVIERAFTLDLKVVNTLNQPLSGMNVKLTDSAGNQLFGAGGLTTDANGEIGQKTITTDVFRYSGPNTGTRQNLNTFSLEVIDPGGQLNPVTQTLDIQAAQNFSVVLSSACDPIGSDKAYPIRVSTSSAAQFTPTITIWGAKTGESGCGAYGSLACDADRGMTEANAINFTQIQEFAAFAFGSCAVTKPAAGTFTVNGFMNIGSTTASTTFVKTASESIDFGKQMRMYASSTFISGEVSATGSPFAGSTLAFSGTDATSTSEGQFFILATSTPQPTDPSVPAATLKLFDTIILHKTAATTTPDNPRDLYWNGKVEARRTSFENWNAIRFLNATNTLVDVVFTNMFRGFFPESNQGASTTFETIKSRRNIQGGLYATSSANYTIKEMNITDIDDEKHIRLFNYGGTANLVNSAFNETKIEYNGSGSGKINQQYTVDYTIVDANGNPVSGAEVELLDVRGDTIFLQSTNASGVVPQQKVIAKSFDYANQTGVTNNPHTLRIRKYGFDFITLTTSITAQIIQTIALTADKFKGVATETEADAITGITFTAPIKVTYTNAETELVGADDVIVLDNASTTQSEFFALFNNATGAKIPTTDFTVNYGAANGKAIITFINGYEAVTVRAVYSYGGSITLTNGTVNTRSLTQIYDFLRGQQEEVFTTVDGIAYTSFIDIDVGDATTRGSIVDPNKSLIFKQGFSLRFGAAGGFVDLSGVTAGGGMNIFDSVGSTYFPGETVSIASTVQDNKGILAGGVGITVTIRNQNNAIVTTGTSNEITTGFYRFNYTLPLTAATGTYFAQIDAALGGEEIHDNVSFIVNPRLGNFPLAISSAVGSIYEPGDLVTVFSNTIDQVGKPIDTNVDVYIFDPTETRIFSASSTKLSTGLYKATSTLATTSPPGTYRTRTDANLGGTSTTTAALAFIVMRPPLNIHNNVGSTYNAGDTVRIFTTAMSASGTPITGANIDVYVYNPSDALVSSGSSTPITGAPGFYERSFTLSGSAPLGAYRVKIDSQYQGFEAHDNLAFIVKEPSTSLPLNIYNDVGSTYKPRDEVAVFSTVITATGTPVAANVDVYIYKLDNTLLFSASSTQLSTGFFKATTTLATTTPAGTYRVKIDAFFGGNEIHDVKAFVVTRPPLTIKNETSNLYVLGDTISVFTTAMEQDGALVDAGVDVYIFKPDDTLLFSASSTKLSIGFFKAATTLATTSPTGTYRVKIDAQYAGQEAHDNAAFLAAKSISGLPLNVFNDVGTSYKPRDKVSIFSTAVSATGTPVSASITVNIFDPSGTSIVSGASTQLSTGFFEFSFTLATSSSAGTYRVKVDAIYGSNEAHDSFAFVVARPALKLISSVGASYLLGNMIEILSTVMEDNGALASSTVDVFIYKPDNTLFFSASSTQLSTGFFKATTTIATTSPTGTYRVKIDTQFAGNEAHESLAFVVNAPSTAQLLTYNNVGANYKPGDEVAVFTTAVNATGTTISPNIDVYIFKPDDTLFASASSTQLSTGFFKATATLIGKITSIASTSPVTLLNDTATGTVAWIDPTNATSSNNIYASSTLATSQVSNYLLATNFGFAVPVDAAIEGIVIEVERNKGGPRTVRDNAVRIVKGGVIGATDRASAADWLMTDAIANYGSSTDLWGETWTPTSVNASDFGVAISAKEMGIGTVDAHIDHVRITVYYRPAITLGTYRVKVDAQLSGNETHDSLAFVVDAIGASQPLTLFNHAGATYQPGDEVAVFTTAVNATGTLVSADVLVSIFNPSGSFLFKGTSTEITTGFFKFATATSTTTPLGTYRVQVDSSYAGNEAHDSLAFVMDRPILTMKNGVGGEYLLGDRVEVLSSVMRSNGKPASAKVDVYIFKPDNTLLFSASSTEISTGFFKATTTIATTSPLGTYRVRIDAFFEGDEVHDTLAFVVKEADTSLSLITYNSAGSSYAPGEQVAVFTTAITATGTPVSANVTVSIFDPTNTQIFSGVSTQLSAGFFKATTTFATTSPSGTYRVKIDAQYQGKEVHDSLAFVVTKAPLNIASNVGSTYNPSGTVRIFTTAMSASGTPITGANIDVYVYNPSDALVSSGSSTPITGAPGFYERSFTLSGSAPLGTYRVKIDSQYQGFEAHDNLAFVVESASTGSGGFALNLFDAAGGEYKPGDEVAIFTTAVSASGTPVSATVDVYIYKPDNSLLFSASSTQLSTGFFKATTTLATTSPVGTYRVKVDAFYSGNEIHDVLAFTVSPLETGFSLNMFNDAGTHYNLGDEAAVYTTVFSATGTPVDANVDVYFFKPDGSLLKSASSTKLVTGFFKATTTIATTSPIGTYSIKIDGFYQGSEVHNTLVFVVASSSAAAPSLNLRSNTGSLYRKGDTVFVNSTVFDSGGQLINANIDVYIFKPDGAFLFFASSTKIDNGFYRATTTLATTTPAGTYRVKIDAFSGGNEAHENISFVVEPTNWTIILSDFGEVFASASAKYRTKVFIFNPQNALSTPFSTPTVTIYDPARNVQVSSGAMTQLETGVYEYVLSLSSGSGAGTWETIVSVETEQNQFFKQNDFWEVESAPAQVIVNSIIDNFVPDITANVTITNEGSVPFEYKYEWCITLEQNHQCFEGGNVAYASAAKLIQPGVDFNTNLTLTVPSTERGVRYFRVVVTWGTEKSFSTRQFDARGFTVQDEKFVRLQPTAATSSTLTTTEGTTITQNIPVGAADVEANYHITRLPKTEVLAQFPAPSGLSMLGNFVFGFRAGDVSTGSTIASFNNPIAVTFTYNDSLLGNLDESSLRLYRNPQDGSGWAALANGSVDTTNNIITGETAAFSKFAVFGSEVAPSPAPAPSGGGGGGAPSVPYQPAAVITPIACNGADFNRDGKVNSTDFSILLFFWKTSPPFANACVDINKDKQVNSVDFSILLFQWGTAGATLGANSVSILNTFAIIESHRLQSQLTATDSSAVMSKKWYNFEIKRELALKI